MLLLVTWLLTCAVISVPAAAVHAWLSARGERDERILVVAPLVAIGVAGYATFFAFFLHRVIGFAFVYAVVAGSGYFWRRRRRSASAHSPLLAPLGLVVGLGLAYLALLFLPDTGRAPEFQASTRFVFELPLDSNLPMMLGDKLYAGEPAKPFLPEAGWLSSDRPPLQSGLYLLVRPWLSPLGLPAGWIYQCVGTLAQLAWVPALWLLARRLELGRARSLALVLLVAATGFALLNSTYVWPKLLAGGFGLIAGVLLLDGSSPRTRTVCALAGAAAALAWLAHGGVAFSLLPLALLLLWPGLFPGWRHAAIGALAFALLVLPWTAYQKFYDPPGNRLLKWHLAGVVDIDERGTLQTVREAYAAQPHAVWVNAKAANYGTLRDRMFRSVFDIFTTGAYQRKVDEFFYVFRSLGVLNAAWLLAPFAWLLRRRLPPKFPLQFTLAVWTLLTLLVWPALMFKPASTLLHQGSYTMMLALFALAVVFLLQLPRWLGRPVLAWSVLSFALTWLPYYHPGPIDAAMFPMIALGILITAVAAHGVDMAEQFSFARIAALLARVRTWLRAPAGRYPWRLALLTAGAGVLLLFMRRPGCFTRPQFWAEDGPVFFMQARFLHGDALFLPYGGYHHFLLRLVAAAGSGLDPLWAPAFYFWSSVLVFVGVILAVFSPRLDLPHRPWLALAIISIPQTGEAFDSLTNVQWISALGLVLLLLARDPRRAGEWFVDLAAALVVGLTGVFSLLFLPLFIWRAARRRSGAAWTIAAVTAVAAVVQAITLTKPIPGAVVSHGTFDGPLAASLMLRPWETLLLPTRVVSALPTVVLAALTLVVTIALAIRARDKTRGLLWSAALIVVAATLFKFRHELALLRDSTQGDRYFFLPKVALAWLLIFEWNGPRRWLARVALVLMLWTSLTSFSFERWIDYDWPAWAARIRREESVIVPINPEGLTITYPYQQRKR